MATKTKAKATAKHAGLPRWAKRRGDEIQVRPDIVYPLYLKKLGVKHPSETTQYWLEVARRCFTTDLRARVLGSSPEDGRLRLRILGDEDWRLSNFPPGEGAEQGAQGFRRHYGAAGERLKG